MSVTYQAKPVKVLGVMQWTGKNWPEVYKWLGVNGSKDSVSYEEDRDYLVLHTLTGDQRVRPGGWLVRRIVENSAGMRFSEVRMVEEVPVAA